MHPPMENTGRYLAYRWYRLKHLDAAHQTAWNFAREHWREFLPCDEVAAVRDQQRVPDRGLTATTD